MADPIRIELTRPITDVLRAARKKATAKGGDITGDDTAGTFRGVTPVGTLEGTYRIEGRVAIVEVTSKPVLVPMSLIESKLRDFFA